MISLGNNDYICEIYGLSMILPYYPILSLSNPYPLDNVQIIIERNGGNETRCKKKTATKLFFNHHVALIHTLAPSSAMKANDIN